MIVAMATEVWQSPLFRYCCQCVPMYTRTFHLLLTYIDTHTFHLLPPSPNTPHTNGHPKTKEGSAPHTHTHTHTHTHMYTLTESKTVF